jgi:esterase/lipase superfamily enzyme
MIAAKALGRSRHYVAGRLVLPLALTLVSACATHPTNVLQPVAAIVPKSSVVDMLVVSTRSRSSVPGQVYSGERAEERSLRRILVSIPSDDRRKIGTIQWPRNQVADPRDEFATLRVDPATPRGVDSWFLQVAGKRRKVLIFVHGFNNTFEEAVYRFAQITHDSGTEAAPILFTWPSRGGVFSYLYDRESATNSRDALEFVLTRAATDPNVSDITILAHSMGNWLALEALRQMAIRDGALPSKIRNVIMAAPDVDVDVFQSEYLAMGPRKPRFTLFLSRDDEALSLSRFLAGDKDRLGGIDPEMEPYRSKLQKTNIVVVDLTKLASEDPFGHGKFADSPEIVRLIGRRLIEGQTIAGTDISFGERVIQPRLPPMLAGAAVGGH